MGFFFPRGASTRRQWPGQPVWRQQQQRWVGSGFGCSSQLPIAPLDKGCSQRPYPRWAPSRGLLVPSPWRWWAQSAATSHTRRRSCASVYNVRCFFEFVFIFLNPSVLDQVLKGRIQAWASVQHPEYNLTRCPQVPQSLFNLIGHKTSA